MIRLLYLLYLLGLAVFTVLYIDSFALVLLLASCMIPIIWGITLLFLRRKGMAEVVCPTDRYHTDDSIPITISVSNKGFFPFSHMEAQLCLKHQYGEKSETLCLQFPLHERNTTKLTFYIHAKYSGLLTVTMQKLTVLDYFHLFRIRYPLRNRGITMMVLPKYRKVPFTIASPAIYTPDAETYADHPGDDPSEIFDLRDYREGDAINRIHWKLSSRRDQLIYKEFSHPEEHRILLMFDPSIKAQSSLSQLGMLQEAMFSLFYSLSLELIRREIPHRLLWCTKKGVSIQKIDREEMLIHVFRTFYESVSLTALNTEALHDFCKTEELSSAVCITGDLSSHTLHLLGREIPAHRRTILQLGSQTTRTFDAQGAAVISITPNALNHGISPLIL